MVSFFPKKLKFIIFALRPKQWVKNLFLFLPLIFGRKLFEFPENLNVFLAFILFSVAASAVYLINDLIDVEYDRSHPTKSLRPIASGKVRRRSAVGVSTALILFSVFFSFILNSQFGWIVVTYFFLNLVYSKFIKNWVILDVFCLAFFFILRVIAGCVVASVDFSHWIILMTGLVALFLGFNKRRQDSVSIRRPTASHRGTLAKYNVRFIDQMITATTISMIVAYPLYAMDARTIREFGTNHLLFTVPFVYYGIFRYLYLIHRFSADGDPTRILFSDRLSQLNLALWVISCVGVVYFGI